MKYAKAIIPNLVTIHGVKIAILTVADLVMIVIVVVLRVHGLTKANVLMNTGIQIRLYTGNK